MCERPRGEAAGEVGGDHGPVYRDHTRLDGGAEQGRGVAEPDEQLPTGSDTAEVECGHQTLAAVAATRDEDGPHVGSVEHALEVGAAGRIVTGEVVAARQDRVP